MRSTRTTAPRPHATSRSDSSSSQPLSRPTSRRYAASQMLSITHGPRADSGATRQRLPRSPRLAAVSLDWRSRPSSGPWIVPVQVAGRLRDELPVRAYAPRAWLLPAAACAAHGVCRARRGARRAPMAAPPPRSLPTPGRRQRSRRAPCARRRWPGPPRLAHVVAGGVLTPARQPEPQLKAPLPARTRSACSTCGPSSLASSIASSSSASKTVCPQFRGGRAGVPAPSSRGPLPRSLRFPLHSCPTYDRLPRNRAHTRATAEATLTAFRCARDPRPTVAPAPSPRLDWRLGPLAQAAQCSAPRHRLATGDRRRRHRLYRHARRVRPGHRRATRVRSARWWEPQLTATFDDRRAWRRWRCWRTTVWSASRRPTASCSGSGS